MVIVDSARHVVGGVDTHRDVNVAAVVDMNGGLLGVESFPTTADGHRSLSSWIGEFGTIERVGVEGTGVYGAGIARFLSKASVMVIEVDRPNRQQRRRHGKSDQLDAIEAARAALSGRCAGLAKSGDSFAEAIRVLLIAKRSARSTRIRTIVQLRHLRSDRAISAARRAFTHSTFLRCRNGWARCPRGTEPGEAVVQPVDHRRSRFARQRPEIPTVRRTARAQQRISRTAPGL